MCNLLGLSFNQPIHPSVYFLKLLELSTNNPHGWGLASYKGGSAQIFKEPLRGDTSRLARFLSTYQGILSTLHVAHIRKTSTQAVSYPNTHPFSREMMGKEFVFAHNGNVTRMKTADTGRFKPVGLTDSEHAFCYLLSRIESRAISRWSTDHFLWLRNTLRDMNMHGGLSCIFSNGDYLFCYRDKTGRSGLHFVHGTSKSHARGKKSQRPKGYIIASTPLTNGEWEACIPSELIVFRAGAMVYSSAGHRTA